MIRDVMLVGSIFLAQLSPPDERGFHSFVTSGLAVLGIIYLVIMIWQAVKKPDRNPPIEAEFCTKADLRDHEDGDERTHENIFKKMGGMERGTTQAMQSMSMKLSALEERTSTTNTTLHLQGQKIDRILERLKA